MIALATFTTAGASGTQVSAKTHRRTPVKTSVHANHRSANAQRTRHTFAAHTTTSAAHKRTPEEVGEAAGLAILEGQREPRRYVASRTRRSRPVLRYTVARSTRRRGIARSARPVETAYVSRSAASRTAETEQDDTAAPTAAELSRAANADGATAETLREREPAAQPDAGVDTDHESAVAGRPVQRPVGPVPDAGISMPQDNGSEPGNVSEGSNAAAGASTGDSGAEAEQASLYIPRAAMPAPLRGSLASLERQNERLEAEGLERIEDESDLAARIADGLLVPVPVSNALTVNADLPQEHRYCRPWTARFLADLARAHDAVFHRPIEVSSAVRTVEYQRRLMMTNGNAAPAEGDIVSPHLTGATIDIAKEQMSRDEIAWMRRRLLTLQDAGKIDVEEEFHQACFHITVYKSYAPSRSLHPPLKTASPANRPKHQSEPATASTETGASGL
jgi:hypothetical protein